MKVNKTKLNINTQMFDIRVCLINEIPKLGLISTHMGFGQEIV